MKDSAPNIEKNLNQIAKVSPPPFLFTRIEAVIVAQYSPTTSSFAGPSLTISCLVLVLNVWLFSAFENSTNSSQNDTISIITNSVDLDESNQLYYD